MRASLSVGISPLPGLGLASLLPESRAFSRRPGLPCACPRCSPHFRHVGEILRGEAVRVCTAARHGRGTVRAPDLPGRRAKPRPQWQWLIPLSVILQRPTLGTKSGLDRWASHGAASTLASWAWRCSGAGRAPVVWAERPGRGGGSRVRQGLWSPRPSCLEADARFSLLCPRLP